MSRAPSEDINVSEAGIDPGIGDYLYPPQSTQNRATEGEANFIDGSGPIFSMYMEMATEEDKKMAEAWQADADGILIFTGLFSAAVASLISVSIQDIRENPQDTSNFYLSNIYRTMTDPNISSSLPASPPPFSPPNYAIWVNTLWFLSLVISITCALLATLLQQWARRYLKVTQPHYSPHKRARIRAFFAEGVDKFLLPWAVEALPTMLHVSLFLFFAGLAVFLRNVDITIFKLVLSWVGVCTALYGCITLVPLFRRDSPYCTPLSLPMWHLVTGIHLVTFRVLHWFAGIRFGIATFRRLRVLKERYRKMLVQGMQKTAEENAFTSPPEIDTRSFLWTFDSLDEDHELERFFSGLPGFRSSKMVRDPLPDLTWAQEGKLLNALIELSDRSASSDLLPELVKIRRTVICAKAIDRVHAPQAIRQVLRRIVSKDQHGLVLSSEIARLVRGWDNGDDEETTTIIQAIVLSVLARSQQRDDVWFAVASHELGVPEPVLRNHATHGDSLSLAILIHITRQQFTSSRFENQHWPWHEFSTLLEAASKFDVLDTSLELQHEFCALWNKISRKVQDDNARWMAFRTLGPIRNIYAALHQSTDSAPTQFSASTDDHDAILRQVSSYPFCNVPGHHPDSTLHIHDISAHTPLHDTVALVPVSPTSTHATSKAVPTALHADENRIDVPLLDNNILVSFRPTHQTAMEGPRVTTTVTLSDPATTARATRDMKTSAQEMPSTTPTTLTTDSSVTTSGVVSLRSTANLLVHSDVPVISSSVSPGPMFGDIASTTSPPRPIPAPEPRIAEGSAKAGSHEDKDAIDITSAHHVIHANTTALVDLPAHPPPLPSTPASEIVIVGPSRRESGAEHIGGHPPYTSHGQYDIV